MHARELIEAIDDPSGLIHPERHRHLARRTHPLGKNPVYPEYRPVRGQRAANYEEFMASRQWQKLRQKAERYFGRPINTETIGSFTQQLQASLRLIDQAEAEHKEELEALAIELVFELPEFKRAKAEYEANRLGIDAELADEVSLEGSATSDEPEKKRQSKERTPAEQAWIKQMIQRRHFTNAIIQGAAVSNNYLFELAGQTLDRLHPGLRKAYGLLMAASEVGYWMFPQEAVIAGAHADTQVGMSRLEFNEDGSIIIKARGKSLPVLIQEIIKGLVEAASLASIPEDPEDAEEIISQTDLVDYEAWQMMLGPQLWDQFVEIADAENERELALYLYRYIQEMDVDKFNAFLKEVYSRTPKGMQLLRDLALKVKADLAEAEAEGTQESVPQIVRRLID